MNVYSYWSGNKPEWIDVCLKSIARCCNGTTKFHLLTPDTIASEATVVDSWVKRWLPKRWLDLPPGVGTDCLRAALLYEFGGLWCDADTVCLRNPGDLIKNRHDPKQFLYSRWPTGGERVIAGYVYSPPRHPIAKQWYNFVCDALENSENIGWGDLGEKILTLLVNMSPSSKSSWQIPIETFMPVDIDSNVYQYFDLCENWWRHVDGNTIAFGLNYSWMSHNFPSQMEGVMRSGSSLQGTLIYRLLHEAHYENQKSGVIVDAK